MSAPLTITAGLTARSAAASTGNPSVGFFFDRGRADSARAASRSRRRRPSRRAAHRGTAGTTRYDSRRARRACRRLAQVPAADRGRSREPLDQGTRTLGGSLGSACRRALSRSRSLASGPGPAERETHSRTTSCPEVAAPTRRAPRCRRAPLRARAREDKAAGNHQTARRLRQRRSPNRSRRPGSRSSSTVREHSTTVARAPLSRLTTPSKFRRTRARGPGSPAESSPRDSCLPSPSCPASSSMSAASSAERRAPQNPFEGRLQALAAGEAARPERSGDRKPHRCSRPPDPEEVSPR